MTAEVAEVEKVAPNDGGTIHDYLGKIVEPDEVVQDRDKDWDFEGIMTAVEMKPVEGEGTYVHSRRNVAPQA